MKAGDLNKLLYHYRRRPGQNDQGEIDPNFDLVAGSPHAVGLLPVNLKQAGSDTYAVGHVTYTSNRHFITRYGGAQAGDMVKVSDVMYMVLHVQNIDDMGIEFQLKCAFAE